MEDKFVRYDRRQNVRGLLYWVVLLGIIIAGAYFKNFKLGFLAIPVLVVVLVFYAIKLWHTRSSEGAFAIKYNSHEIIIRKSSGLTRTFQWSDISKITLKAKVAGNGANAGNYFKICEILPENTKSLFVQFSSFDARGEHCAVNREEFAACNAWIQVKVGGERNDF